MLNQDIKILNETGVHARPASALTQLASSFVSEIKFVKDDTIYDAKSIINILSMGLKFEEIINLQVEGIDEADAIVAITELFETKFGEE